MLNYPTASAFNPVHTVMPRNTTQVNGYTQSVCVVKLSRHGTHAQLSMRESRISPITAVELCPCSSTVARPSGSARSEQEERKKYALNAASMTLISVAVVSSPVKAHQSFTTRPAPKTSDPRFTVPAFAWTYQIARPTSKISSETRHIPQEGPGASYSARPDPVCSSSGARSRPGSR